MINAGNSNRLTYHLLDLCMILTDTFEKVRNKLTGCNKYKLRNDKVNNEINKLNLLKNTHTEKQ